jgi:N-acetylated-alpha-linked acidic dipeptidase
LNIFDKDESYRINADNFLKLITLNLLHVMAKRLCILLVNIIVLLSVSFSQSATIPGFDNLTATEEINREKLFDNNLSAASIGKTIRQLSSTPHHLGSPGGKAVADSILNAFKSYGWNAELNVYKVLFPTPKTRLLEMTAPAVYKAGLKEPALKEDATSGQAGQLPAYNAWSADGDVTAALVFVNYGLPADYDWLEKMGISVKDKIVIAKYGRSWRGIKPKLAQEHGAKGCIIYSDPADDGYAAGDVYPKGAFKNEYGVQRGSVMDMPVYPGDPVTPGIGATEGATRIERTSAANLLKIPVLPIGYHDAEPLLKSLGGAAVPAGWQGGLPFTYHIGDDKTKVHLKLAFNWDIVPCYNVIAKIPGTVFPDEWVMRGNHHDAWVNGANDPISGQAAMLEEAKAIGELLKTGWKPKRTIVYCAWDGEEPALLGSTEYVEDHIKELQEKAVVYINSDGNGRGFLSAGGSHALQSMVNEVAQDINDPQTNISVVRRLLAKNAFTSASAAQKKEAFGKKDLELQALGSGSDYSPFLQHAGVPSLSIEYGGEDAGGEYHTIYDSYDDYRRFKDPGFAYGVTLAKTIGHTVLRLTNTSLLPFRFGNLSKTIKTYTDQLMQLVNETRENIAIERDMSYAGYFNLVTDTAKHLTELPVKPTVPFINFAPLQNAIAQLQKTTDSVDAGLTNYIVNNKLQTLNKKLFTAEQQLLLPQGLPRRPWYRHSIYAPGYYTGYGVKTLPAIREAIEQYNWTEAQQGIYDAAKAIERLSEYLK